MVFLSPLLTEGLKPTRSAGWYYLAFLLMEWLYDYVLKINFRENI
jgi:hypothetical protein